MKFYLEHAMDSELIVAADSIEELIRLINNDKIDLDNNYLVMESQLTDEQRGELGLDIPVANSPVTYNNEQEHLIKKNLK